MCIAARGLTCKLSFGPQNNFSLRPLNYSMINNTTCEVKGHTAKIATKISHLMTTMQKVINLAVIIIRRKFVGPEFDS